MLRLEQARNSEFQNYFLVFWHSLKVRASPSIFKVRTCPIFGCFYVEDMIQWSRSICLNIRGKEVLVNGVLDSPKLLSGKHFIIQGSCEIVEFNNLSQFWEKTVSVLFEIQLANSVSSIFKHVQILYRRWIVLVVFVALRLFFIEFFALLILSHFRSDVDRSCHMILRLTMSYR